MVNCLENERCFDGFPVYDQINFDTELFHDEFRKGKSATNIKDTPKFSQNRNDFRRHHTSAFIRQEEKLDNAYDKKSLKNHHIHELNNSYLEGHSSNQTRGMK